MPLSVPDFVKRWKINSLSERSGSQSHFIDLCDMLGQPHPAAADAVGERYAFDKPLTKVYGGKGFADVWLRDHFAWEYKGKHKDLIAAYKQINDYREDLGNPPLLVVCDLDRFQVHTNFTSTTKRIYEFDLTDLDRNQPTANCPLPPLQVLRALFDDTNALRPNRTDAFVTQEAAKVFSRLAERLEIEKRSHTDTPIHTKEEIAHFLMRLLFCLFADSIGLLPKHLFRNLVRSDDRFLPRKFLRKLKALFEAMSQPDGIFGEHTIKYFNGGLFDSSSVIELDTTDLGILYEVTSNFDWSHVAPEIFGTLFERSLNAERRSLIGAHYTSADDILLLIEPVLMRPLENRWAEVKASILTTLNPSANDVILSERSESKDPDAAHTTSTANPLSTNKPKPFSLLHSNPEAERLLGAWIDELTAVRVLDPACGSGNFLYLALRRLLDLWLEAQRFASANNISMVLPKMVSPSQLYGIETEFYAHELASIVVWIGFLQWKHEHGIPDDREPILEKLSNIEHADAILRYDANQQPYEPAWPPADFIIGNPPFLGGKLLRRELGDTYVDDLFALYKGRVKAESDLVVYWFEKARAQLEAGLVDRVGLLATQAIRGGANRAVLDRIQQTGTIFWACSDRKWLLTGAAVRVSMIAFESRQASERTPTSPVISTGGASSAPQWRDPCIPPGTPTNPVILSGARSAQSKDPEAAHLIHTLSPLSATNPNTPTAPGTNAPPYLLDGQPVDFINADLTSGANTASALRLKENENLCFMGTTRIGPFDIEPVAARRMIDAPINPNGRPNGDVVKSWINATDLTGRPRNMHIIDFGVDMPEEAAAQYEMPFQYVYHHVRPERITNRRTSYAEKWWLFGEPRSAMRSALNGLSRFISTPMVSKHRIYVWQEPNVIAENLINVIAREDDYFFGILHSSIHEIWARAQGTQLREVESGFRYTPNSTFDTFPFPWPPGTEPTEADSPLVRAIADAARELVRLRDAWLNPPGSEADLAILKDRTLTKLYNARPEWLTNAHRALDRAVSAAYNWPPDLTDQEFLARLLALNHQRAAA
jgi:type II restriction/modification system DNA methylase subunit YeeA